MEQFIVVFTNKRNIGLTAIPYHAGYSENNPISLIEHVTPGHISKNESRYNDAEKEIVMLLSRISEHALFKKFGGKQISTLKEFIDVLPTLPRFESLIKPFIEKIVYDLIRAIAGTSVPCYYKDDTFSNLYASDRLTIPSEPAQPDFNFEIKEENLHYSLKIRQKSSTGGDDKLFSPAGQPIEFICTNPAVLKIRHTLYYFENLDQKKFNPFLTKTTIIVPRQQVKTYMKTFVSNCIRNYNITAKGFTIDNSEQSPKVQLIMSYDLNHTPALALHFKYDEASFLADRGAAVFVKLEESDQLFHFKKIRRRYDDEKKVMAQLQAWGLKQIGEALFRPKEAHDMTDDAMITSTIVHWLSQHESKLNQIDYSFDANKQNEKLYVGQHSLKIDTSETNDWFEIRAKVEIGEYSISFIKFRRNLIDNDPEYILPNGQIFMIPPEWFTRFSELFNYAKAEQNTIRLPRSHFQIIEQVKYGVSNIKNKETGIHFPETTLPKELNATLRPYQKEGYAWMNFLLENHLGGILADDMGLGKTLQTITLLLKIYATSETTPNSEPATGEQLSLFEAPSPAKFNKTNEPASIIVMPTSLIHNWQNEIQKFAPSIKTYLYTGSNRLKTKDIGKILRHYHVVLTSYGVLRNDIEYLKNYHFHHVILDESQYIKNPGSKIYSAVNSLESSHRLVLTGTPIENSLTDLWAQLNFVNKGLLGTLAFFKRYFIQPITRQQDEAKEEKLQKLIQPFILRRTKEHVAKDLPPIMEQVIHCDMTDEQNQFYEKEKSGVRNSLAHIFESKSPKQSSIIALQALSTLRQIANHPAMVDPNYTGSSGKFEQMLDALQSIVAEKHNVLIFSSFVKDLDLIEKELIQKKLPYAKLTGATRERQKVIEEFNQNAAIFLISLKAGGVGLNLTKADYVFMLNPWWNPAAEAQAINRAHRIGQDKNVFVYRFISTGTIEEKIARLQQNKSMLADTFVHSNNPLNDLSKDEIMALLG